MSRKFIPFSLPKIEGEEITEVLEVLRSGWITTGAKVKQFEEEFARYVGCKQAVGVNSCTAALHLALHAIGIQEGDEVITTPFTFAATAEAICYFKAKPVFVDVDVRDMNIAPGKIEEVITPSTRAIIPVHFAGQPCSMDQIRDIAERYKLKIIEDAAHAFPSLYKGKKVGTIGDITCFSFYATKNITTGEGGMAATENEEWADRMRVMSLHGISKDAWKRYTAEGSWYYEIIATGYKYNLADLAAALGIAQLKKADTFWERRMQIASRYNEAFGEVAEIEIPISASQPLSSDTKHSWHLYVIRLNLECLTIDRNRFIDELKDRGVGASVHFIPLHIHPYYRETYGYKPEDFPVSYEMYKRIISLPIYPKMTDGDVGRVIDAVKDVARLFRR